jgi:hypothetical protein
MLGKKETETSRQRVWNEMHRKRIGAQRTEKIIKKGGYSDEPFGGQFSQPQRLLKTHTQ